MWALAGSIRYQLLAGTAGFHSAYIKIEFSDVKVKKPREGG
jgi:hypothetical protein